MNMNTPFAENGSVAIFGKWYWNDVRARPDLFGIVSWGCLASRRLYQAQSISDLLFKDSRAAGQKTLQSGPGRLAPDPSQSPGTHGAHPVISVFFKTSDQIL
jgi:hypothetical protein